MRWPVISGVLRAGAGVILVRHIPRGHSTGPDAAGDVTMFLAIVSLFEELRYTLYSIDDGNTHLLLLVRAV